MNQENKVVKISDVVKNQIPEFILSENPNFEEFLKQYYISQEYQGSSVDIVENLISYKNIDTFDLTNLISETTLTSDVEYFDDVINVESTNGWPREYGLLKIDDEIITYTGITSTSFTGCIRGFSGISSLTQENNPEFLVFSQTESSTHTENAIVQNLSNLFLKEFFRKVKYQFTPGFEERNFAPQINPQNFISKARTFYQSKGTDEAFKILFKVLYAGDVKVIKPDDYCFTSSDDKWRVVETLVCELVSGDPLNIDGQTLYQDDFPQYNITNANGSIYNVEYFDKEGNRFYKIQLFSGYSNNLNPKGSIEGTFVATPKTFLVEDISDNSTIITVNSTIGFPNEGILEIGGLVISYTDKTNNQFLNCSGVTSNLSKKSEVFLDHYVYAYEKNSSNLVKFKLCNVLSKLSSSDVLFSYEGDPIKIDQLGSTKDSVFLNSLVYNIPVTVSCGYAVNTLTNNIRNNQKEGFSLSNGSALSKYPHLLRFGDTVDLYIKNSSSPIKENLTVNILSDKEFSVSVDEIDNSIIGKKVLFKRHIKKSPYSNLGLTANIQDSYIDSDNYYLTSNGLPEYQINPLTFDKDFSTISLDSLECADNHHFKTGDEVSVVSYASTSIFNNDIGISTGNSYYVNYVNSKVINLVQSRENIGISSFIPFYEYDSFGNPYVGITSIKLIPTSQYQRNFSSSKIFKKFPKNIELSTTKQNTSPGNVGIFVNGVEIRNYKSFDKIYYGEVTSATILNSGSDYDLKNPPKLEVIYDNEVKPNVKIFPHLIGKLDKIFVIDPGYDYIEVPSVKILGGNSDNVITEVKMKKVVNEINFNATTKDTIIDTVNNTFNFKFKHRFVTGEPILYKSFGTTPIGIGTNVSGGFLSDNSVYYAVNIGAGTSISLAFNKEDAIAETNLVNLRTFGGGFQSFISTIPKQGIDEVNIIETGKNFEYKKVSFIEENVNTQDDIITIENHGFSDGEEIVYSFEKVPGFTFSGNGIVGLSTTQYYYVVKIDENRLKLSSTKNTISYVNLISTRKYAVNYFSYSPIRVEIKGTISVDGTSELGYSAEVVPIVKGSAYSAFVQKNPNVLLTNGNSYIDYFGDKNILNYEDAPIIKVVEGEGASLQPLIIDGKISQIIVKNSGSGYFNSFDLIVEGSGFGAKLSPVVSNGQIIGVDIVNSGVGYASTNTVIKLVPTGKNLRLKANIKSWTVNQVEKDSDVANGVISGKNYSYYGNTYGLYFLNDQLRNFFNIPNSPTEHSPIIGWAYDGCPIYGPYAYKNADGTGGIVRMFSGYAYQNTVGSNFKLVEEYEFKNLGTLDKYNGRFCITPEYPKGIYAYFCTLDDNNLPQFPYVIGPQYNYSVINYNLDLKNNQSLNFNDLDIIKNTKPYRVEDKESKYDYFEFFNSEKDIIIEKSSVGVIDEIYVLNGGLNYKIGDSVVFDNEGTSGFGAIAEVSEISGVGITTITSQSSTLSNVTFISDGVTVVGIASTYHSLKNNSYIKISSINTDTFKSIEGFRKINVSSFTTGLTTSIQSASSTGIVTSIRVNSSIYDFEIDSQLKITNEIVRVIGLDYKNNQINILRPLSGPSHSTSEPVEILQDKFTCTSLNSDKTIYEKNVSYYFNPSQSVSIGTITSPGVGNTLSIYPLGYGEPYTKYVQTTGIYLPNNKFNTGDKVVYTVSGSSIVTNIGDLNSIDNLYVVKLEPDVVGLVTSKTNVSDRDSLLKYTSSGSGTLHKLTTQRNIVTGNILSNNCTVYTSEKHNLSVGDLINLKVTSGVTTSYLVSYNDNRVLINSEINPKIDLYSNEKVIFDLSDPSLIGKDFNLYLDENFKNTYFGNFYNGVEVEKLDDQLILTISDHTPKNLFYNLSDTIQDLTVNGYNQIKINTSLYNTQSEVTSVSDYNFTINLDNLTERQSYTTPSSLSYVVLSGDSTGPINAVDVKSQGSNYKKLPQIISINSNDGLGSNLFVKSSSIGKIEKTKVNNTKFICPSDKTLSPNSNVFSALNLIDNYTVDSLTVSYGGKNYISPPLVNLYNEKTGSTIANFSASASLKNNSVDSITILNPGHGLSSEDNKLVFTNNTNGFKIINVTVSGVSPYTVTLTLQTPVSGFSTSNPLPISIGDEIFVEGIAYNGNGFNSENYGYKPFTVTFVNPAYGSQDAAIVRYQVDENPGSYDEDTTYNANVIPYSYLPTASIKLKQNEFYSNESIADTKIINNSNNSPITNIVKVENLSNLKIGDIIVGKSSRSQGQIADIKTFNSKFYSDYSTSEVLGGVENRGYLSSNIQKLSDNDYYQKFSYSLKSKYQFSDWNSAVSDTSHIAGYKKFSDLSIESVSIGTTESIKSTSASTVNVILDSYVDVNSVFDYDLVNEIDLEDNNFEYTEYLKFNRLKLGNSIQSTDNRVLSIDDISRLFVTESIIPSLPVDNILNFDSTTLKYEFYLSSTKSFLGQFTYPEIFEVLVSRNNNDIFLTSYSNYFDIQNLGSDPFFGTFTAEVNPNNDREIIIYFTPKNPFLTIDIKSIKESTPNTVGIATTSFGYIKNVELCNTYAGLSTEVVYTIPSSQCKSGTLIVGISSSFNCIEKSFEASFVDTGTDILISRYAENTLNELGTINIVKNGSNLQFNYSGVGIGVTVQTNLKLITNTNNGNSPVNKAISKIASSQITTNASSTGISTISGDYGYTKYTMEIEQNTGISTQRSIVQLNTIHFENYLNTILYDANGNIDLGDLSFVMDYNIIGNNYTLYFNPVTSADYKITIYETSLLSPIQ